MMEPTAVHNHGGDADTTEAVIHDRQRQWIAQLMAFFAGRLIVQRAGDCSKVGAGQVIFRSITFVADITE